MGTKVLTRGQAITKTAAGLNVPNQPIIPYIRGDGTGVDISPVMMKVVDAAVEKAFAGKRRIEWMKVLAGDEAVEANHPGLSAEKIAAIPHWAVADVWTPLERAVLAWTDGLIQDRGRVAAGVFEALSALMSDEDILELTYHVCGYNTHAVMCRALRLEYDDVPERVEEVPMPDGPGVQDWAGRAWSKPA